MTMQLISEIKLWLSTASLGLIVNELLAKELAGVSFRRWLRSSNKRMARRT